MKYNNQAFTIVALMSLIAYLLLAIPYSIFIEYSVIGLLVLLVITFISKKSNTQQRWKM